MKGRLSQLAASGPGELVPTSIGVPRPVLHVGDTGYGPPGLTNETVFSSNYRDPLEKVVFALVAPQGSVDPDLCHSYSETSSLSALLDQTGGHYGDPHCSGMALCMW